MTRVNFATEKFLRVLVIIFVLFNAFTPVVAHAQPATIIGNSDANREASLKSQGKYVPPVFTHAKARQVDSDILPIATIHADDNTDILSSVSSANAGSDVTASENRSPNISDLYQSNICVQPLAGLIDWWSADGDANDIVGGHHGALISGTSFVPGVVGQAFNFDGVDDYVNLGNWFNLQGFTISMWIKPGASQMTYADIIDNNHRTAINWVAQQNGSSTNQYYFDAAGPFNLIADQWQYLALSHDSNGEEKVYIDGLLVATGTYGPPINYNGTQYLRLGAWGGGGRYWKGQMDEVDVYNRALSDSEIVSMFNAGNAGKCHDQSVVSASSDPIIADNLNSATIDITLKDSYGNLLPNHTVSIAASGSENTISPSTVQTDINGSAIFFLKSTRAEVKTITIFDQTQGTVLYGKPTVTFVSGSVNAQNSTIKANLTGVTNDGVNAIVTVTALDDYDNPVPGAAISVSATGSAVIAEPGAVTNAQGKATVTLTDAVAETVTVSAVIDGALISRVFSIRLANTTIDTPRGYWALDENYGALAYDQGLGAHDGTLNGVTPWAQGRHYDATLLPTDYALQFNGTDSYVSVMDAFDPTAYTIAMWVKPTAINRNIFVRTTSSGPNSSTSHNIYINSSGYFCAYTYDGGGKTVCGTTKVNTTNPTWYHVASSASNSGQLKLYVNGKQEGASVNIGTLWTGGDRYYIGSNRSGAGYFSGVMDEVRFYNSALSSTDIFAIYNPDQSIVEVPVTSLVADNLDTAVVQVTLKDSSGNILPNHALSMNVSGTGNTISPTTVQTDANGLASFTLKSTKAETKTITIFDQTQAVILASTPTVSFISGPVNPQKSKVVSSSTTVLSNGTTSATITVTALDGYDNPISGAIVSVEATGSAIVTQPVTSTDALGKVTASITNAVIESVTVSAKINEIPIQQIAAIRFNCYATSDLVVANGDACSFASGAYTYNSITVQTGGTLILQGNTSLGQGVEIDVNNLTVEANGVITADGQGYARSNGPGAGPSGGQAAGGGHGGQGGRGSGTSVGGSAYGDLYAPVTLGSGGGNGWNRGTGGAGGGAIHLIVNDTLTLNGMINSNGANGNAYFGAGGGGAGGSIWIDASVLSGNGQVHANGGNGASSYGAAGGGGGGRIAIEVPSSGNSFNGAVTAYGGWGYQYGGAGTVYWAEMDRIIVDNNAHLGAATGIPAGNHYFTHIDIKGQGILRVLGAGSTLTLDIDTLEGSDGTGRLEVEGILNAPENFIIDTTTIVILNDISGTLNITTQNGGGLEFNANSASHPDGIYSFENIVIKADTILRLVSYDGTQNDYGVTLDVNNLTVEANGVITADGQGYARTNGPGAGPSGGQAAGGGHGGQGGRGSGTSVGGIAYGDLYAPVTLGSGGGNGGNGGTGGAGGGAIHLIVNDSLTLNGTINSNGANGNAYYGAGGGGAGGSIWIDASVLSGNGQVHANGGNGASSYGAAGGGGGGRIAIYTNTLASTVQLSVAGGSGYQSGGDGTVYLDGLDASLSTLTISPSNPTADGTSTATVTVTLKNADGIPVPNREVDLALASGSVLSINNQPVEVDQYITIGNTNSNGVVTTTLKTTVAGARTLKARSGPEPLLQQGTVEFVPGPVNGIVSKIIASPTTVPADGQTQITVTVTALDSYNNPIPGAEVALQSTGSASIIQPAAPTNSLGKTTGKITNTVGETVTITATVNGVLLDDTVDLNFSSGDLALSMTAPETAVANSTMNYTITVQQSNEMPAENVTLQLQLPVDVAYVTQNSTFIPTQNGQTLTWDLGTFDPGENLSFDVNGHISASKAVGETLSAEANVTSSSPEATLANNTATSQTTIVDGHGFAAFISPSSRITGIGAATLYEITIQNTGLVDDQYDLVVSGLDPQWYSLPQTRVNLLPGQSIILPLTVQANSCSASGSVPFEVGITSIANQQDETLSASVNFESGPQVSGLVPQGGSVLGSRNVTVNWQTDAQSTGVLNIFPIGQPENTLTFNSEQGTSHSIVVPNLDRNVTYEWYVDAASDCGTTALPHRTLTIGNGIVFIKRSQSVTIDRDYNQRVSVAVRNDDNIAHTLTASMLNPYEDILVNFVDSGSVDQTITLQAGETRQVTLAIHTQDAQLQTYDLTASLTADQDSAPIYDNMTLHVTVLSEGDYTIVEDVAAFDEITLARTYVITNHGKAITDLSLIALDPATGQPARIFLQPSLDHARLETGQSIRVTAYPIFTAEDAAAQASALASSQFASSSSGDSPLNIGLQTSPAPAVAPITFNLEANGAGVTKSLPGTTSCGGGRVIMPVVMQDCTMTFETRDWYCTNRPNITTPIQVPAFITDASIASAKLSIVYAPRTNVEPHNGQVSFNGTQIGSYSSQIPTGQFSFDIPASTWQNSVAGSALQTVQMSTQHPNPGHYVSATGYKLDVAISQATTFVCADSETTALQVVKETYACGAAYIFNWQTDVYGDSVNFSCNNGSCGAAGGSTGATESSCGAMCGTQMTGGDPINTRTGVYSAAFSDLSFPTRAGELIVQRSYSSNAIDLYTDTLAYGWTFNHDSKLIFPEDENGMAGFVLFKAPTGNQYLFKIEADGSYTAGPGVVASLDKSATVYKVTTSQQDTFTFDLNGRLLARANEQGYAFDYDYDSDGNLIKVSADPSTGSGQAGTRFIQITYDNSNRIVTINDHAGRQVVYGYNAAGDLVAVTDVLGQHWVFTYDSAHHMTQIKDPSGAQSVQTEYDLQGRAFKQFDGEGKLLTNIVFNADGTSTAYNALGLAETHEYDNHNTLVGTSNPMGADTSKTYDPNFRPATITDANGDTTTLTWSADGANLTSVTDAEGNQTSITYDALNNPASVVDAGGFLTTFEYDGTLLTSSTDALNQETTYTYTPEGDLASVTDALGNTTTYAYNAYGQRTSMTDALGNTWSYSYDSLGQLIDATDPLGRVTHSEYDAAGRLTSQTLNYDAGKTQNQDNVWNIVTSYQYDARGNQTSVTDTFGRTTLYAYDNAGRLVTATDPDGNVNRSAYDAAGQLTSTTDALGHATQYQYDAAGRLVRTTDPLGSITRTTYNPDGTMASTIDGLGRATSYTYDSLKRVITVTQPNGGTTHNTYDDLGNLVMTTDALGNSTQYTYDALGRLIKTTDPLGNFTETFYDSAGRVIQTKDARGNATTYAYDSAGRQTSVTDALGNVTSYEYDPLGRRISVTDANGNVSTYTYDELNRVVTVTDALGHSTTTTYDALGQTLARTDANGNRVNYAYDVLNRLTSQTNALGGVTSFAYDAAGNRLSATDANGHTSTTSYDALNRPTSFTDANNLTTTNGYDGAGNLIVSTDALGNTTVNAYNALNQPIVMRDALGNQTTQAYNARGELISTTDAEGITTAYEYDALGRLTAVIENYSAAQLADNETNVRTEYTYDQNGNRLTIRDGNGHVTTFTYDALNRLVSESDPLGNTWSYAYDSLGNRISMTDANGATTTYTYDDANRLTDITYPDSTVSFTYDNGGRRLTMTDSVGTTHWAYNALDQVTAITDPFNKTVSYSYDSVGNRVTLTYPDGQTVSYAYDAGNRLSSVNSEQSSVISYQYDAANRLTNITRPNDVNTAYAYDTANRLLSITHASGTELLSSFQYLYDHVGNRIQAIEELKNPIPPTLTPTLTFTPTQTPTATFTPIQAVDAIMDQVDAFVADGSIQANLQNSLISKLTNASQKLENGQTNAAVNELEAFINQVEAQRGKKITVEAADALIALINAIIDQLGLLPTPTETLPPTATVTPSPTGTMTESGTLTPSLTPSETPTQTETPAESPTLTPEASETPTATETMTPTATFLPTQALTTLMDQVDAYVTDGSIQASLQNKLNGKLTDASQKLESGQTDAAVDDLQAFLGQVETQRGKKITVEAADDLTAQAQAIITTLTPTPLPQGEGGTPTPTPTITPTSTALSYLPEGVFAASLNLPPVFDFKSDAPAFLYQGPNITTTIDYSYDPLYRLTSADYSTGVFYHYTYDSVGNRLTASDQLSTTSYQYDDANRLASVDGVDYIFDDNGNLLSGGANTYTYDSANRLVSVSTQSSVSSYQYNGLGDRLQQTVKGVSTNYTLDLNTGLTQVLGDGINTYTYGLGRISQTNTNTEYFIGDALGSVRQMTDPASEITFTQNYDPYGVVTSTSGDSHTDYGYTGEQYGDSTQLLYLRARYYNPTDGRFTSRDTWGGNDNSPQSLNRWGYVEENPINLVDPTGHISEGPQAQKADLIVEKLKQYNVYIVKDWGYKQIPYFSLLPQSVQSIYPNGCYWEEGNWRNAKELQLTFDAVRKMAQEMGGVSKFTAAFRGRPIKVIRLLEKENTAGEAPHPPANYIAGDVVLYNGSFRTHYSPERSMGYVVHELAHVWDAKYGYDISVEYADFINPYTTFCGHCLRIWDPNNHITYFPTKYSKKNELEFWAESVTVYIFPSLAELNGLSSLSKGFIRKKFQNLH